MFLNQITYPAFKHCNRHLLNWVFLRISECSEHYKDNFMLGQINSLQHSAFLCLSFALSVSQCVKHKVFVMRSCWVCLKGQLVESDHWLFLKIAFRAQDKCIKWPWLWPDAGPASAHINAWNTCLFDFLNSLKHVRTHIVSSHWLKFN